MAVISAENSTFVFTVYGAENEITDILSFSLGGKNTYEIGIGEYSGEFCAVFSTNNKSEYFALINDSFTLSSDPPQNITPIARYKNKKITALTENTRIFDVLNDIKLYKTSQIRLEEAELSSSEKSEILRLIKACADIMEYDSESSDDTELIRRVLYSHDNFKLLSSLSSGFTNIDGNIKLCSADFTDDVMQKAFRRTPEKPPVNMLTSLGYCYNNSSYYYTGGYNTYFATDVQELIRIMKLSDTDLFIVFSDTYKEGDAEPLLEYSTAVISRDKNGFYLKRLDMCGNIEIPRELIVSDSQKRHINIHDIYTQCAIAALLAVAAAGVSIWLRRIKRR